MMEPSKESKLTFAQSKLTLEFHLTDGSVVKGATVDADYIKLFNDEQVADYLQNNFKGHGIWRDKTRKEFIPMSQVAKITWTFHE